MQLVKAAISRMGNKRFAWELNPEALIPSLIAMLTLQMFRASQYRWIPAICLETAFSVGLPLLAFWLIRRWAKHQVPARPTMTTYLCQAGVIPVALFAVGWQIASRSFGLGDANEIVALLVLQNTGLYLAVFSNVPGFEKTSIVISSALVFFVSCMTPRIGVFILAGLFAMTVLWRLAGLYWIRLDAKAIDGVSRMLPIHGTSVFVAVLVIGGALILALLFVPNSPSPFAGEGFSPFSGGQNGFQDEFAMSGIGDGDMLTAGEDASTAGAVDSDEFIEDDKSSMYDVVNEQYEGPAFKGKRSRAVALDVVAKHMHNVKKSEQEGKTFRTMRHSKQTDEIDYQDKMTKALFFVEGSVPARFAIDTFQHFDGWDWSKASSPPIRSTQPAIEVQTRGSKPVFALRQVQPEYLVSRRPHRVKIMRLKSACIPAPAFLSRWHIAFVNEPSLFFWNDAGLIQLDADSIPSHTVIDLESYVPNYYVMRSMERLRPHRQASAWSPVTHRNPPGSPASPSANHGFDAPYLQIPENQTKKKLQELASQWTSDIEPGWRQVEAIVARLRNDFVLDPEWEVNEEADDTVGHFLRQGGGPSYMFATTCAMVLRAAGYRTRLTNGFVVQKSDFNRRSGQSIVTSKNLHMWPEVCMDGKFWVPVEPTPGFPIPYSTATVWEWLTAKFFLIADWIRRHPAISIFVGVVMGLAFFFRHELIAGLMLLWWYLIRLAWPRGILKTTRQLIDVRFWAAGRSRPASQTIWAWYSRVEPSLSTQFFKLWNAKNYCDHPPRVSSQELVVSCREQIEALPLSKIKRSNPPETSKRTEKQ